MVGSEAGGSSDEPEVRGGAGVGASGGGGVGRAAVTASPAYSVNSLPDLPELPPSPTMRLVKAGTLGGPPLTTPRSLSLTLSLPPRRLWLRCACMCE
jgi:hypothetical protein